MMGQGVRTGFGHGASSVSYRHNFLVVHEKQSNIHTITSFEPSV